MKLRVRPIWEKPMWAAMVMFWKLESPYEEGFLSEQKEMGTDVFVIGFKENFNTSWIELMTLSVIRNFFGSILEGKLTVKLKNFNGKKNIAGYQFH